MKKTTRMITSQSPEQTQDIAYKIGVIIPAGTVLAAYGDLGMGKTCFASGLARGMNIDDPIISPTYIFFNIYQGETPFAHIDAYRLEGLSEEEIALTGIEECFDQQTVVFIEWPGFISDWLDEQTVELHISQGDSDNERLLEFIYDQDTQGWIDEAFSH